MSKNPEDENSKLYSIMDQLPRLSQSLGEFRLRLCYPEIEEADQRCNEWIQTSKPATDTILEGFRPINWKHSNSFRGLGRNEVEGFALIDDAPHITNGLNYIGTNQLFRGKSVGPEPLPGKYVLINKVELYIAVLEGWRPCSLPVSCSSGDMCDSRPGKESCSPIPPTCPASPLVADSTLGCLCPEAGSICEVGQRCDVAGAECSPPTECPNPAGNVDMLDDHPDQTMFNTSEADGWEDMNLTMPEIPILIKAMNGTVVGYIKWLDGKVDLSDDVPIGIVDIETESVSMGRLQRWSNGLMVLIGDFNTNTTTTIIPPIGRVEEKFLEGMMATFQCVHHFFITDGVSFYYKCTTHGVSGTFFHGSKERHWLQLHLPEHW